jgi:prepilin peptidase CpaA
MWRESADAIVGLSLLTLLLIGAFTDLRSRRIDNRIGLGLILLFALHQLLAASAPPPWRSVAIGIGMLVVGIIIWRRGLIGGGDAKLLAVMAMWAGPTEVVGFLVATSLAGGVLALLTLWYRHIGWAYLAPLRTTMGQIAASRLPTVGIGISAGLPYGVAIAAGGCWLWLRLFVN